MRTLTRHCLLQSHWLWPFRRPLNAKWGVTNDPLENPKFCFSSAFWAFEKGVVVSAVHVNLKRQPCLEKNFQRCVWNYWPRDSRQGFMLFFPPFVQSGKWIRHLLTQSQFLLALCHFETWNTVQYIVVIHTFTPAWNNSWFLDNKGVLKPLISWISLLNAIFSQMSDWGLVFATLNREEI